MFIDWCAFAFAHPCPWHGGECGAPVLSEAGDTLSVEPTPGFTVYARLAVGDDAPLADTITAQLRHVAEHQARGRDAVAGLVPDKLRAWFERNGHDPVDSWLEQRLCDIVLNLGQDMFGPELLARIPG
ncbi:hypothetical protein ACWC5I_37210 [Kitasatospora sp. NPDC001574]